ncbi:MAG: hypothetical protein L7U83_13565 [Akkermansiaceae bacterium]|nr:hypothetical protein [Akkermansiaceae bacterium]
MKFLSLFILLTSSLLGFAEEDFPVLSLQRKKWEEARITAQAKVDKSYLLRLQELKKDSVKKGDLDAARAFDKAIKGVAKGDEEEPASLTKMRTARAKALEAAFKPIDKKYWEDLKLLKGYSQRQGDLEKMEVLIAEIDKVMAPYEKEGNTAQTPLLGNRDKKLKDSDDTRAVMRVDGDGKSYRQILGKFTFPMKKNGSYRYQAKVWHSLNEHQLNKHDGRPDFKKKDRHWNSEEYEVYKAIYDTMKFENSEKDKDGWYEFTCDFTYPLDDHKAALQIAFRDHKVVFIKDFSLLDKETGDDLLQGGIIHKRHWNNAEFLSFTSKIYPTDKNWPDLQTKETE